VYDVDTGLKISNGLSEAFPALDGRMQSPRFQSQDSVQSSSRTLPWMSPVPVPPPPPPKGLPFATQSVNNHLDELIGSGLLEKGVANRDRRALENPKDGPGCARKCGNDCALM